MSRATKSTRPEPAGLVIHGAARYDLLVWLFTLGGERRFREKILRLAALKPGEAVLDVGCGTGTLAILAKHKVGNEGKVQGVDASPEMISQAKQKAQRARVDVEFIEAAIQALPLADRSQDVVLSTLMMHHLPRKTRPEIAREIRRVLKRGGRLLVVDFAKPAPGRRNLMDRFHRHGFIKLDDLIPELEAAGFAIAKSAEVGERNLHYLIATVGAPSVSALQDQTEEATPHAGKHDHGVDGHSHGSRHSQGLLLLGLGAVAAPVLAAMHAGLLLTLYRSLADLRVSPLIYVGVALAALIVAVLHFFGGRILAGLIGAKTGKIDAD